jgi:toxin ParE1/3/4
MSIKYRLSKLAEEDLLNIFQTTYKKWGENKAKQYAHEIDKTFKKLSKFPNIGKKRNEIFLNALSFSVKTHIIFYKKDEKGILVARILHQRMDYEQYF